MKQSKIIVAGIGPGNEQDITPAVITALQEADAVVGYKYYFRFVTPHLRPGTECIDNLLREGKNLILGRQPGKPIGVTDIFFLAYP